MRTAMINVVELKIRMSRKVKVQLSEWTFGPNRGTEPCAGATAILGLIACILRNHVNSASLHLYQTDQ